MQYEIIETVRYVVEADSPEHAEDLIVNSEDPDSFATGVTDREINELTTPPTTD